MSNPICYHCHRAAVKEIENFKSYWLCETCHIKVDSTGMEIEIEDVSKDLESRVYNV